MGTSIEGGIQLTPPSLPNSSLIGDLNQPSQSIYEQSETQQYPLGTPLRYVDGTGRIFRYAKNGGVALSKARMTQTQVVETKLEDEAQSTSGTSVEVGDLEIVIDITTASSLVENDLAQAMMVINLSDGIGDVNKILASKLIVGDDTKIRLLLETPIRTALAAATEITIIKNRWNGVVIFPSTRTGTATGIPLIDVTIAYYCWLQTGGPAPCITDDGETMVIGAPIGEPGTHADDGAIGIVANDGTDEVWGFCLYKAVADQTTLVDLTLDR